jgi:hypothetical protein
MKDSRIGETLWSEWFGNGYNKGTPKALVFYTEDHVDIHNEVVRRALASAIQRDGTTDSLGEAFRLLDGPVLVSHGFAGFLDDGEELSLCDKDAMTIYEDEVDSVLQITWVEINVE